MFNPLSILSQLPQLNYISYPVAAVLSYGIANLILYLIRGGKPIA